MANERWNSPFNRTIAFFLFRKHFTELNDVYWAHVPASNTIEKKALEALGTTDASPLQYFLISDEDDRRVASTYQEWKTNYRDFSNYTRLNMIMLLSSCFETYLRTVVSLSFESKPGVLINSPDAVDGWFLLRNSKAYGEFGSNTYQFSDVIDSICRGDWNSRAAAFEKYFGKIPLSDAEIDELDDLRKKRNLLGHYFGREKSIYEAPLIFEPTPVQRVSHDKLIKFFRTVFQAAEKIDSYLHRNYIGSYDIMKYFSVHSENHGDPNATVGDQSKELQQMLGRLNLPRLSMEYYRNIVSYMLIENKDDSFRYTKKACIATIQRLLKLHNIMLNVEGRNIPFTEYHFQLFSNVYSARSNPQYSKKYNRGGKTEYFFSLDLINLIVEEIKANPSEVIQNLQAKKKAQS